MCKYCKIYLGLTDKLIDCVPANLVTFQGLRLTSVAEILLRLKPYLSAQTSERVNICFHTRTGVDFYLNEQGLLTPFKRKEWKKYLVAKRKMHHDDPPIRPDILYKLRKKHSNKILEAWLWPPKEKSLIWDRSYRSFLSAIKLSPSLVNREVSGYGGSREKDISNAVTVLVGQTTSNISPKGQRNRLPTPIFRSPADIPQLNVLYRGTKYRYAHPLIPSSYREFKNIVEAQEYNRILIFSINLVIEAVFDEFGYLLTHNEAESIIQHYKIIPWTRMIDLTTDVNIAKAFAANLKESNMDPCLYEVVIWNLDFFDTGGKLIKKLPLARPDGQSAVAHFGLGFDMSTGNIFDKYGFIMAVTEHSFENGAGWEPFGGSAFYIKGTKFSGPLLNMRNYNRLQSLLYFRKFETSKSLRALKRIINTIERNIDFFAELGTRIVNVREGIGLAKKLYCR